MMRFRSFLEEGLVKLPPKTEKQIKEFVKSFLFKTIEQTIKKNDYFNKETLLKGMKQSNVKFRKPRSMPVKRQGNYIISQVDVSNKGLPDNYNIPKGIKLDIIIDFDGNFASGPDHLASYMRKGDNRGIALNMQNNIMPIFLKSTKVDQAAHNFEYMINSLISSMDHELTHAIQDIIVPGGLVGNAKVIKTKADYDKKDDAYLTSPVEFEAMLKTAIFQFQQHVRDMEKLGVKVNIRKDMETFVRMRKANFLTGIQPNDFFKALRKVAPKKHQIAVKKFTVEIDKWLKSRSKN